jgi:hypothetical protein
VKRLDAAKSGTDHVFRLPALSRHGCHEKRGLSPISIPDFDFAISPISPISPDFPDFAPAPRLPEFVCVQMKVG